MDKANPETEIRAFTKSEWHVYKHARLNALKDSPDAFASTYETTSTLTDVAWQSRIEKLDFDTNYPIAAFRNDQVAGMAWVMLEADIANLFQMWVAPNCRGLGIGAAILDDAIRWATRQGAKVIHLGVTVGDTPARRLYESVGFTPVGELEPLREGSELMIQNMTLTLNATSSRKR